MASKEALYRARSNPQVVEFLNLIARAEGTTKHGYNTTFGGAAFADLSRHPNIQQSFRQTDGKMNSSGAAGRYQFINKTWQGLANKYQFNDFGAVNQDLGAIALIAEKGALKDVESGNFVSAINKLGKVWASLPSSTYKQNKRSWEYVLGGNYAGDQGKGGNSAFGDMSAINQAYDDILSNYKTVEETPAIKQGDMNQIVKGLSEPPEGLSGALGFMSNPTPTANNMGVMSAPTPSPQNIGVMSPLASVLFKG